MNAWFYNKGSEVPVEGARAQTGIKEPDKAFITLERFQRDHGAGRGAWSGGSPAAARVDWMRRPMRGRGWRRGRGFGSRKETRRQDCKTLLTDA